MTREDGSRASPADDIVEAFAAGRLVGLPSDCDPSLDEDGAYLIASEVHARRIERGERPVGRKIGFTNRGVWAEYGVDAPIWGHVYDSTVLYATDGHADVAVDHLIQPCVEPEIQLLSLIHI